MRRMIWTTALAWVAGFCMATSIAFGYALLDAWRGFGADFQLGYIVGYLDAAKLQQRRDARASGIPSERQVNYERWRDLVNAYFEDPAHAKKSVPDAIAAIADNLREEKMKAYSARPRLLTSPSPAPSLTPTPPTPTARP
jgi:hypothetical protein